MVPLNHNRFARLSDSESIVRRSVASQILRQTRNESYTVYTSSRFASMGTGDRFPYRFQVLEIARYWDWTGRLEMCPAKTFRTSCSESAQTWGETSLRCLRSLLGFMTGVGDTNKPHSLSGTQ
jgi:hypothetical protein